MTDRDRYVQALREGARAIGIDVTPELAHALATHHELVVKWAQKINLTTVTEPERAASIHGLDSLLFAELFDREDQAAVIDVGSGAGFPGLVLALARPRLAVRLWEPQRKRASFLHVALAELGRADVRVEERRLERVRADRSAPLETACIVSRATIPPLELVEIAPRYLLPEGRLILSGGAGLPPLEELLRAARGALRAERTLDVELPGGEPRVLHLLRRTSA